MGKELRDSRLLVSRNSLPISIHYSVQPSALLPDGLKGNSKHVISPQILITLLNFSKPIKG